VNAENVLIGVTQDMMTKDEALKELFDSINGDCCVGQDREQELISIIKKALEQPAQEPLGWIPATYKYNLMSNDDEYPIGMVYHSKRDEDDVAVYTHPAPQTAQEAVACHCGNPAFNPQSITHTKTKCFQHSLQNPVAWTDEYEMFLEFDKEILCDKAVCKEHEAIPLYTHPHQWVVLTDDEINSFYGKSTYEGLNGFARAIELALKDKNT
jgi:hypothetical protein